MKLHTESKHLESFRFKGHQWNPVLELQPCHLQPCAPFLTTLEWIQHHCPRSPLSSLSPARTHPEQVHTSCVPSANSMAPANTRAANSPTLNPAAATQFSMTCGDRAEHEAESSGRAQSWDMPPLPPELAGQLCVTMSQFYWPGTPLY